MAAKLVVTKARGGSKISLIGTSGTELLTSKVFMEPRAKGATLRSLKGLLGDDVVVDDQTATASPKPAETSSRQPSPTKAVAATATRRATARVSSAAKAAAKASKSQGAVKASRRGSARSASK